VNTLPELTRELDACIAVLAGVGAINKSDGESYSCWPRNTPAEIAKCAAALLDRASRDVADMRRHRAEVAAAPLPPVDFAGETAYHKRVRAGALRKLDEIVARAAARPSRLRALIEACAVVAAAE